MAYQCYKLTDTSRKKIMALFAPKYPDVRYDHITIKMCSPRAQKPQPAESVCLVGLVDDNHGIQAFLVKVNGTVIRPSDHSFWHMTASFDAHQEVLPELKNPNTKDTHYRPVTSNLLLKQVLEPTGQPKKFLSSQYQIKLFDKPIFIETVPALQFSSAELKKLPKTR